jgi:hypothetical protein
MSDTKVMLRYDGDTVKLEDGRVLLLSIIPDDGYTIEDDGDWFGRIEWVGQSSGLPGNRPSYMDGAAEVIDRGRNAQLWWQPPSDVVNNPDLRRSLRVELMRILNEGYYAYRLEVCRGEDYYGNPIVENVATIGGVAPVYNPEGKDYLIADLLNELEITL